MYNTFKDIANKAIAEGKNYPIAAKGPDGDDVIIESLITQEKDGRHFFRVATMQTDGTTRINRYYEDGEVRETFEK